MRRVLACALFGLPVLASAAPLAWRVESSVAPGALRSPAVTRADVIAIDTEALRLGDDFELQVPGGQRHRLHVSAREMHGKHGMTLRGALDNPSYSVTLSVQDGKVAGLVTAPEGNYEVMPLADGGHAIALLDQAAFPECDGGIPVQNAVVEDLGSGAVQVDPPGQVDVLVFYSPQALAAAGGVSQIRATARAAVDNANTAFSNSDMVTRFYLLDVLPVTRDEGSGDLAWLAGNADVVTKRNELGADLVSLMVESSISGCGVGYVMRSPGAGFASSAFQVTKRSCAVGNLTFAHEHGHNMGMEHNPENGSSPSSASYEWSFGHYVSGSFRTVMSYSDPCASSCSRRPYFSNPDVNFNGVPTGIANLRDNHRTGNAVASIVANFRARVGLFADDFEGP